MNKQFQEAGRKWVLSVHNENGQQQAYKREQEASEAVSKYE